MGLVRRGVAGHARKCRTRSEHRARTRARDESRWRLRRVSAFGDSGGPILLAGTRTVLGVNSFVNNWNCAGIGYAQRVDLTPILAWINSHL